MCFYLSPKTFEIKKQTLSAVLFSSEFLLLWCKSDTKYLCLSTNPHSSITDGNLSDPYPPALISHWCTGTNYGYLAWFPRWSPLKHSGKHLSAQFVHKPLYVLYHLLKSFQIPTEELWLTTKSSSQSAPIKQAAPMRHRNSLIVLSGFLELFFHCTN